MKVIKQEIVKHLEVNNKTKELQGGFTSGSRLEDNLFILYYCVQESYKNKLPLVLCAIDYAKAFDSINRKELINALKYYKCLL